MNFPLFNHSVSTSIQTLKLLFYSLLNAAMSLCGFLLDKLSLKTFIEFTSGLLHLQSNGDLSGQSVSMPIKALYWFYSVLFNTSRSY